VLNHIPECRFFSYVWVFARDQFARDQLGRQRMLFAKFPQAGGQPEAGPSRRC
jgi:hypothetical protein